MQLDVPFPVESCSRRLRAAILAEFRGRCPTIRQVVNVPDRRWLSTPGLGSISFRELQHLMQGLLSKDGERPLARLSDAELLAKRDQLWCQLGSLRSDVEAITVELLLRAGPHQRKALELSTGEGSVFP
jgi:hypothetical protein